MLKSYKNSTLYQFKTAYIFDKITKERIYFKYREMTAKEITESQFMRGLDTMTNTLTIATSKVININTKSIIIINGIMYSVNSITKELTSNFNGFVRKANEYINYILLVGGGNE